MSPWFFLIDGSNFCYPKNRPEGRPKRADLSRLDDLNRAIARRWPGIEVVTFIDYSLRFDLEDPDVERLDALEAEGKVTVAPDGTKADPFLLEFAREQRAVVLTGDRFAEYTELRLGVPFLRPMFVERAERQVVFDPMITLYWRTDAGRIVEIRAPIDALLQEPGDLARFVASRLDEGDRFGGAPGTAEEMRNLEDAMVAVIRELGGNAGIQRLTATMRRRHPRFDEWLRRVETGEDRGRLLRFLRRSRRVDILEQDDRLWVNVRPEAEPPPLAAPDAHEDPPIRIGGTTWNSLQEAIGRGRSEEIVLGPGVWVITRVIDPNVPLRIRGAGAGQTILRFEGDNVGIRAFHAPAVLVDLTLDAGPSLVCDIVVARDQDIHLERCHILNANRDAARKIGGTGVLLLGRAEATLLDCLLAEHSWNGIELRDDASAEIVACTIERCGSGIAWRDHARGSASRNVVRDNEGDGIAIRKAASPLIARNDCLRNKRCGIFASGEVILEIRDNACIGNARGIQIKSDSGVVLAGNLVEHNTDAGISLERTTSGTVSGNWVLSNQGNGIAVRDSASPRLHGNHLLTNGRAGLFLGERANPTVDPDNEWVDNAEGDTVDHRRHRNAPPDAANGNG